MGKNRMVYLMALSLALVSCSPVGRQKLLTTLFDGVQSEKIESDVAMDTINIVDSSGIIGISNGIAQSNMYYHEPYQNKSCGQCHDQRHMGTLVAEQPLLCYKCHDNKNENQSFQHGPSAAGLCTSCHHPHKSASKNLLHEDGKELCTICHDTDDIISNNIHKGIKGNKNCTECHDPHASDLRFMMKKEVCKKCHEVNQEKFMHGPVESDYCSMCHDSHESKEKYLLLAKGQQLCMNCHEASNVFSDEIHRKEEIKNCTSCHNPHGGTQKFMLTE